MNVLFFFTYPYYSFNLTLQGYPVTFVIMGIIYVIISLMTTDIKKQEQLLAQRERDLAEAKNEKMRANLLRAISHDLRTPLAGIIGNSEACLDMENYLTTEEKHQLIENIRTDAKWLLNMVENLLTVTKISGENLKLKKSFEAVDEVMSAAVSKFRKRFTDVNLKVFPPDDLIMITMDAMLIEQVIINLLQNAAMHSYSKKPIELRVYENDDKVWFSIRDYGVGIPPKKLSTIFDGEEYDTSEENRADAHRGMGIGLSICKTIVVAHGGQIQAENLDEGCEFRFYLPKEKEEE
jgi:two-component system sensor histidine kinase KdpD